MRFVWLAVSLGAAVAGFAAAVEYWSIVSDSALYGPMVYIILFALTVCLLFSLGTALSGASKAGASPTAPAGSYSGDFAGVMASLEWCIAFMVIVMGQVPTKGGNAAFVGAMLAGVAFVVFAVRHFRKRRKVQPKS
jgi:hypothetical protein